MVPTDWSCRTKRAAKLIVALFMLVSVAAPAMGDTRSEAEPPNIVFILVDDLGWGDLSCYGQTNWATPRLDRMADEGMRFERAYAGSTVCAPSRAALMIGNHTGELHIRGNGKIQLRRSTHDVTIATRLRELGYATAMIGKSGVACNSSDLKLPHDKGFDEFYGLLSHIEAHRHYPRELVDNGQWVEIEGNAGKTGEVYASELFVERA
ncbi:MAG: sulfatase-like hydrolase/transferase, partial [Planctomycetota bacterium]